MPVFEQGYRAYEGEFRRRSPLPAMVWTNVRTRMKWWVWLLAACLLFYPHLVYGVLVFVFTAGQALLGVPTPSGLTGGIPSTVYERRGGFNPDVLISMLQSSSTEGALSLYWSALEASVLANIVLTSVACGGVIANDRATRAMEVYFARPVSRVQYLASKILTVACFSALVTTAPTLLLWMESVAFQPNIEFVAHTWMAPFSIVAAGSLHALWAASIVLALSSVLRRPLLVAVSGIFGFFLLKILAQMLARASQDKVWRVLDPQYALGGATAPLFGLDLPDWLATPWLVLPAFVVPLALLAVVWTRVRAVEVST